MQAVCAVSILRGALVAALALAPLAAAAAGEGSFTGAIAVSIASEASESPPRVFIAAPVGHVGVDRGADILGQPMYSVRSAVSGAGSEVMFSATKPRPAGVPSLVSGAQLLGGMLTSSFGAPRMALGGGLRAHAGIDLAAPIGSPVAASMDGRVSRASWVGGYGLLVALEHTGGIETRYAHLSRIGVAPGQVVHKGEVIGLVGSTGHSTGPHLHYEVRQNGRPVNPLAR